MNKLQQVAMSWLDQGIATIPILYRSKRPNFAALMETGDIDQDGKPTWDRMKNNLPGKLDILTWYKSPLSNIAVICSWQNLVIVDFDNMDAYDLWIQLYGQEGWADTYTVCTGRGYHLYYYIEDMPKYTMKWVGGEIKASGYCLCPPSVHPTGTAYKAIDTPIMDIKSISDLLPDEIFNHVGMPCREVQLDPFSPAVPGGFSDIKDSIRILSFFPDAKRTGNGWYTVYCPFHGDGTQRGHASGWIDDNRNRFGCHACVTGSLSVIDFYMRLHNVDAETAVRELINK